MACAVLGGPLLLNTIIKKPRPASSSSLHTATLPSPKLCIKSRGTRSSPPSVLLIRANSMATEKLGIKIERNPPQSKLTQLGISSWPKWGCPPSKFPWTYESKETCYLLEGKVKVTPEGANDSVEISAGDLVEFPKGMSCTWDVSVKVDKHYKFED